MNPIENPFSPGAGTQPPELAGRDDIRNQVYIAIERIRRGRSAKSVLMVGLRGVGKTVLLDRMKLDAEAGGHFTLRAEAPEERSLPALLAPQLRQALLKLSRVESAKEFAQRALRGLSGFAGALKAKFGDIELSMDLPSEPGLADNGDLEADLADLLVSVGEAAKAGDTSLLMFIDELQYVQEAQLAALISALHRTSQLGLPVVLIGAGLPQLPGRMGKAKSYAERLFDFPEIGALDWAAATLALTEPVNDLGVQFEPEALKVIWEETKGYPYFIQEWGKHAWDLATKSPITKENCLDATKHATAALDANFFRVRWDRLTPSEKLYMRAMAELGGGPHRSGDIAQILDRQVQSLAPTRANLISKGMIWSPSHGDTGFTVPLFDQFLKRIMPELP
jgi:hypothetical protein